MLYLATTSIIDLPRKFATCSADKTIKIFNVDGNKGFDYSRTLLGHTRWVWDCEFLRDSTKMISVSTDNYLKVWDLESGSILKNTTQHQKGVTCCVLHDRPTEDY